MKLSLLFKKVINNLTAFSPDNRTSRAPGNTVNNAKTAEINIHKRICGKNLVQAGAIKIYQPFHLKETLNTSISIPNIDSRGEVVCKLEDISVWGFPG